MAMTAMNMVGESGGGSISSFNVVDKGSIPAGSTGRSYTVDLNKSYIIFLGSKSTSGTDAQVTSTYTLIKGTLTGVDVGSLLSATLTGTTLKMVHAGSSTQGTCVVCEIG